MTDNKPSLSAGTAKPKRITGVKVNAGRTPGRIRTSGYDPAVRSAAELGEKVIALVQKTSASGRSTANFRVKKSPSVEGGWILLVDEVGLRLRQRKAPPYKISKGLVSNKEYVREKTQAPGKQVDADLNRAFAEAGVRGADRVASILSGEDMLSADDFAHALRTTKVTIHQWRKQNKVLALEGAIRGSRFPEWQIGTDGKPFSAIPRLFEKLGNAWAVYRFLVQHHPELEGATGREALLKGRISEALEAADAVAGGSS